MIEWLKYTQLYLIYYAWWTFNFAKWTISTALATPMNSHKKPHILIGDLMFHNFNQQVKLGIIPKT